MLGPLFKLLEASFELFIPLLVRRIIDIGVAGRDADYIIKNGALMVALGLIGLVCSLAAQYFSAKAAVFASAAIKSDVFRNIMSLSYSEIDNIGTSTMITRMTGDINTLQNGINMSLRLLLRSPFVVFGAVIMSFFIDLNAAGIFVLTVIFLAVVVYGVMFITAPLHKNVQGKLDTVTLSLRSSLNGVRVIRAFGLEKSMQKEFTDANGDLVQLQLRTGKISALLNPVTFVMINGAAIWLIWSGAISVDAGTLTQGSVVALINYMSQILVELIKLANLIVLLNKAIASGDRINDLFRIEPDIKDTYRDEGQPGDPGNEDEGFIRFEHVSLKCSDTGDEALSDIDLSVKRGETIGIIGGTGSGKSSVVNLIPRFYDATQGKVIVDGLDVKGQDIKALRARIGMVPQKAVLFKGTIAENLRWGNEDANEDELAEAVRMAVCTDVVDAKGGFDGMIEQNGRNLSGGQRQRLTIARALVRKPEILILDDSASALDFATDLKLRQNIAQTDHKMTVFIVSQRTSAVQNADKIMVLDDGCVVGLGTHEDLLKDCPVYKEIYDSNT